MAIRKRRTGVAGCLLLAGLLAVSLGCSPETGAPLNLVLVSLDTTRPDHLSAYGYERQTSPNFDRVATDGALFHNAFAQWTATGPSHTSMLTALYPPTHRFGLTRKRLRRRFPTMASILGGHGYRTGAFVSGFTLKGKLARGLDRGFEVWNDDFKGIRRDGRETVTLALDWLRSGEPDRPYFLFFHLFDAHGPYTSQGRYPMVFESTEPGPRLDRVPVSQRLGEGVNGFSVRLNDYVDAYDSGLFYQDGILGELLAEIDLERTVLLVVADHGESMGEHGGVVNLTHATAVFDDQTRIPFLIRAPGIAPGQFHEIVETVDLLPTALDLLGIEPPRPLAAEGRSLAELLRGERRERADELAFSGTWAQQRQRVSGQQIFDHVLPLRLDESRPVFATRSQRWKLVVYPGPTADWVALFDLESDPGEKVNVAEREPEIRDRMLERSRLWLAAPEEGPEEFDLTTDELDKLRALGYVD